MRRWLALAAVLLAAGGISAWLGVPVLERRAIDGFKLANAKLDCCSTGRAKPECQEAWRGLKRAASGFGDEAYVAGTMVLECDPPPELAAARRREEKAREDLLAQQRAEQVRLQDEAARRRANEEEEQRRKEQEEARRLRPSAWANCDLLEVPPTAVP